MKQQGLISALDPETEQNAWLRRFKTTRAAKWSLKSGRSLADMATLAACLVSLGRYEEAAQLGEYVALNVQFRGNFDIWTFAAAAISTGTLACRKLNDDERADRLFLPVRGKPSTIVNIEATEATVQGLPIRLARKRPDSIAPAIWEFAEKLEQFRDGRPGTEVYPVAAMQAGLEPCLARIRELIEKK